MKTCYLCPRKLEGIDVSEEHIILNAIAGRLVSKDLICKPCNSKLGDSADRELANQLSPLTSLLIVKGKRKDIQDIKTVRTGTDEGITIKDGHRPTFSKPDFKIEPIDEKQASISIRTRNEKEMLEKLREIKARYKNFDIEEAKKHMVYSSEYIDSLTISMTIGGDMAMRSIAKTAVNFYIHTQNKTESVKHLFKYIKGEEELKITKHFYPKKSIYKKEPFEMVHLLHLIGDKHSKQLYCYVEFFSTYSFIVRLSETYVGESFTETYCEDVLQKKTLNKRVNLKLKEVEMSNLFSYTKDEFENIRERFKRTRKIIDKVQNDNAINIMINESMKEHFGNEGEIITEKMLHAFFNDVSMKFTEMQYRGRKTVPKILL